MRLQKRLTLEEHRQTGKMLAEQFRQLEELLKITNGRLGSDSDGRNAYKQLRKLLQTNLDLRFYLDSIASQDFPKEYNGELYYGNQNPERELVLWEVLWEVL